MRKIMTLFLIFLPASVYPQFQDYFDDGLFHNRPVSEGTVNWEGDISEFVVNGDNQLQLSSDVSKNPAQLRTTSSLTKNTCWNFYAQMDFTPSASNYVKVYLMSDREDLCDELNGIFIRIGHTDKNICLIQSQIGKNNKTLIKGKTKRLDLSSVKIQIKVTVDNFGNFYLYSRLEEEKEFVLEGSCQLSTHFQSQWFGIVCTFTATRSQLFYFDDFIIEPFNTDESIESPLYNEILINEILFNPNPGSTEYVEIINHSDKEFDLRSISITSRKPSDGSFNKIYPLSNFPENLKSGKYLVITGSKDLVCNFYSCPGTALFAEPEGMPSLANTSGCVVILNNQTGEIIDEFYYLESMHSEGIKNKKGVALERISLKKPTNQASNWTSALSLSGYGTPGYINSQQNSHADESSANSAVKNTFLIEYPNSATDQYHIKYQLDKTGYYSRIILFDIQGRILEYILNNEILNAEGRIPWNNPKQLNAGIYIIYAEIFDMSGDIHHSKLPLIIN